MLQHLPLSPVPAPSAAARGKPNLSMSVSPSFPSLSLLSQFESCNGLGKSFCILNHVLLAPELRHRDPKACIIPTSALESLPRFILLLAPFPPTGLINHGHR